MNRLINGFCKALLLVVLLVSCENGFAQIIKGDSYLDIFASTYIKSLDEFMQRFNAEEYHPDIDTANNENLRIRSILTLFDLQKFQLEDSIIAGQLVSFADTVCKNDIHLYLEGGGVYAEACCLFSYNQKELPINLVFVFENIRDDYYRWAIAGVNGLIECGLMDTVNDGYINPTQHEVRFTELSSACSDLNRFVSVHKVLDQLSYFLGMIKTRQLEFVTCNKVVFYFIQVPGYAFVVNEVNKLDNNSGYLISTLVRIEDSDKLDYIKQLLGQKIEKR